MKKMIVAGLLALTLAVAPGVAFGAATTPLLPAADATACAGCATGFHRVACPATIAQSLFTTIDHCASRVHGCLGMSGTANTDDRAANPTSGFCYQDQNGNGLCDRQENGTCPNSEACPTDGTICPRHGEACPNGACPADGTACPRHGDACPYASTAPQSGSDDRAGDADASDGWTCPRSGHHGNGHGCGSGAGHGCRR